MDPTAVVVVDSVSLHVTVLSALELLSLLHRISTGRNMWEYALLATRHEASEQKESEFRQRTYCNSHEALASAIDCYVPRNRCDRRNTVPLFRSQVFKDDIRDSMRGGNNCEYISTNASSIAIDLGKFSSFLAIL